MHAAQLPETRSPPPHFEPAGEPRSRAEARCDRAPASTDLVRVFEADPDLLGDLDPATGDLLRRRAVAPKLWIDPGPWSPPAPRHEREWFGLLVLGGLIMRSVRLDDRDSPEIIGAGDLLRPWDPDQNISIRASISWAALERTTVAVLDEQFAGIICRWPRIVSGLLARSADYSRTLAFQRAIMHVRRAEIRLHMLLWHLADRWGRVTPHGVHLPLALTHETLAQLSCIRRPTASTALQVLTRTGELERRRDGTWLLKGTPPSSAG
ncbi:MAG: helix-turn-helix domain-containing protein [Thermoleophilia bacterium]